jgi:hypothetical protein
LGEGPRVKEGEGAVRDGVGVRLDANDHVLLADVVHQPVSRGGKSAISKEGARRVWERGRGGADIPVMVLNLPQKCTKHFCGKLNTETALKFS